jgi:hypothetical protein
MNKVSNNIAIAVLFLLMIQNATAQCTRWYATNYDPDVFVNGNKSTILLDLYSTPVTTTAAPLGCLEFYRGFAEVFKEDFLRENTLDLSTWKTVPDWGGSPALFDRCKSMEVFLPGMVAVTNGGAGYCALGANEVPTTYLIDPTKGPSELVLCDTEYVENERVALYQAGMIWSKFDFPRGRYEIRAKIPNNTYMTPSFWMWRYLPTSTDQRHTEIDVLKFST